MKKEVKILVLYALFLIFISIFPNFKKEVKNFDEFQNYVESNFNLPNEIDEENNQYPEVGEENNVRYKVLSVTDGDTFRIDYKGVSTPVRMIGIDTPEVNHPSEPVQCYGKEASDKTKEVLAGQEVVLEQDVSETDRYGRILAYVWLNGELINEKLVKEGYAFSSSYPPDVKYQERFNEAEKYARTNNLGLWADDTCDGDVYKTTTQESEN